jgi:hypothetical protein
MKISPVGAELFPAGGKKQTDVTKLIVAFRSFVKALKRRAVDITLGNIMGADAARGPRVMFLCHI